MRPAIDRVAVASARSTRNFPTPANRAPPSTPHRRRRTGRATAAHPRHRAHDARKALQWSPTCIYANQAHHQRPPAATPPPIPYSLSSTQMPTHSLAPCVLSRSPCSRIRLLSKAGCLFFSCGICLRSFTLARAPQPTLLLAHAALPCLPPTEKDRASWHRHDVNDCSKDYKWPPNEVPTTAKRIPYERHTATIRIPYDRHTTTIRIPSDSRTFAFAHVVRRALGVVVERSLHFDICIHMRARVSYK